VARGQQVQLQIESVAEPRTAEVTRISPTLDPLSRSLMFEAQIDNPDGQLRTGLFAEAELVVEPEAQSLVLPLSAVVRFAGAEKVWKVVDGVAAEQEVFTGQQRGDRIEILRGVSSGDVVLRNGAEGRIAKILPPGDEKEPLEIAVDRSAAVTVSSRDHSSVEGQSL
jgi:multidrug efflux pump subunit AcrA (membrane-fusion protein)